MPKVNHKIKAFTITEILIVMVITAIVAGLAFGVLNILNKNLSGISKGFGYKSEVQLLEQGLKTDMTNFTEISWNDTEQQLKFTSPIQSKIYRFYKDSIVNEQLSYKLITFDKVFYLNGNEITNGEIDALKLRFHKSKEMHNIFVYKQNDITSYFRNGNKTN